jgi:hypothetical protein
MFVGHIRQSLAGVALSSRRRADVAIERQARILCHREEAGRRGDRAAGAVAWLATGLLRYRSRRLATTGKGMMNAAAVAWYQWLTWHRDS